MRIYSVAAVVAAFGVCGIASAQSSIEAPSNISVRIGAAIPIEKSLGDVASNFLAFGLEYQFSSSVFGGGETYIAVDYWTRTLSDTDNRITPITLNQRWYGGTRSGGRRTYTFIGAGIAYTNFGNSDSAFCFRGGFGVELGTNTFGEFAALVGDKAGAVRPNAITFSLGYRF